MNVTGLCKVCGGTRYQPQVISVGGLLSHTCVDWFHTTLVMLGGHLYVGCNDGTDDPNLYLGNPK